MPRKKKQTPDLLKSGDYLPTKNRVFPLLSDYVSCSNPFKTAAQPNVCVSLIDEIRVEAGAIINTLEQLGANEATAAEQWRKCFSWDADKVLPPLKSGLPDIPIPTLPGDTPAIAKDAEAALQVLCSLYSLTVIGNSKGTEVSSVAVFAHGARVGACINAMLTRHLERSTKIGRNLRFSRMEAAHTRQDNLEEKHALWLEEYDRIKKLHPKMSVTKASPEVKRQTMATETPDYIAKVIRRRQKDQ